MLPGRIIEPARSWDGGRRAVDAPGDLKEDVIALNPDRVGHHYTAYRYEVCREKVREYALATGVEDPTYTADPGEVDAASIVAPPTFAACFTVARGASLEMFADPALGAHPRLVHGSQEYVFHRPVRVGDTLECDPWVADISVRGRNEFLTMQIDCADAGSGEPVLTSRATIIFLGSAPQAAPGGSAPQEEEKG